MSGDHNTVLMRRSDGSIDSVVYFPDATTAKPDADGAVRVPLENVMAMMLAGYEVDEVDFEGWCRVMMNSNS
jgi:hypothetical protein